MPVKGFLERLQWKLAVWMQGRYGIDGFSRMLVVFGLALTIASLLPYLGALSWIAFLVLAYALFRAFSKNHAKRMHENEAYERLSAKPKQAVSVVGKAWRNRKTTRYFKCKGCGTVLSVPRGKGKLRVTCPKCHMQTLRKS